jgi:hypothetical protein
MEKKISLTTSDIVKYLFFVGTVISMFVAMQAKNMEQDGRIEKLENENKVLRQCQGETAEDVANINGKLDQINENVNAIKDHIIERGLNR